MSQSPVVRPCVLTCSLQTGTFTTRRNVYGIPATRGLHIPHWQLRDLVQCIPVSPQSVYYLNNSVLRDLEFIAGTTIIHSKYGISINGEVMGLSNYLSLLITVLFPQIKRVWSE